MPTTRLTNFDVEQTDDAYIGRFTTEITTDDVEELIDYLATLKANRDDVGDALLTIGDGGVVLDSNTADVDGRDAGTDPDTDATLAGRDTEHDHADEILSEGWGQGTTHGPTAYTRRSWDRNEERLALENAKGETRHLRNGSKEYLVLWCAAAAQHEHGPVTTTDVAEQGYVARGSVQGAFTRLRMFGCLERVDPSAYTNARHALTRTGVWYLKQFGEPPQDHPNADVPDVDTA